MKTPSTGFRAVFAKWAARYRSFARTRFVRFSEGGGNWPSLAKSTIAARRRKVKRPKKYKQGASTLLSMRPRILRDTGLLLAALQPTFGNVPGQLEAMLSDGVRVGYGGPHRYPKGGPTIADVAEFHQLGKGRVPVRKIIVDPDSATLAGMTEDLRRDIARG